MGENNHEWDEEAYIEACERLNAVILELWECGCDEDDIDYAFRMAKQEAT